MKIKGTPDEIIALFKLLNTLVKSDFVKRNADNAAKKQNRQNNSVDPQKISDKVVNELDKYFDRFNPNNREATDDTD